MLELIENAADLHRIIIDLETEKKFKHANVLRTTLDLELKSIWGDKDNGEVQEGRFDCSASDALQVLGAD